MLRPLTLITLLFWAFFANATVTPQQAKQFVATFDTLFMAKDGKRMAGLLHPQFTYSYGDHSTAHDLKYHMPKSLFIKHMSNPINNLKLTHSQLFRGMDGFHVLKVMPVEGGLSKVRIKSSFTFRLKRRDHYVIYEMLLVPHQGQLYLRELFETYSEKPRSRDR